MYFNLIPYTFPPIIPLEKDFQDSAKGIFTFIFSKMLENVKSILKLQDNDLRDIRDGLLDEFETEAIRAMNRQKESNLLKLEIFVLEWMEMNEIRKMKFSTSTPFMFFSRSSLDKLVGPR